MLDYIYVQLHLTPQLHHAQAPSKAVEMLGNRSRNVRVIWVWEVIRQKHPSGRSGAGAGGESSQRANEVGKDIGSRQVDLEETRACLKTNGEDPVKREPFELQE